MWHDLKVRDIKHDWECLCMLLPILLPRLPKPQDEDKEDELDIAGAVKLESFRAKIRETTKIEVNDRDAILEPVKAKGMASRSGDADDLAKVLLSEILESLDADLNG